MADFFQDNKRARRTDVHDAEFRHLFRQQSRLKSLVATHIDGAKKYDQSHVAQIVSSCQIGQSRKPIRNWLMQD